METVSKNVRNTKKAEKACTLKKSEILILENSKSSRLDTYYIHDSKHQLVYPIRVLVFSDENDLNRITTSDYFDVPKGAHFSLRPYLFSMDDIFMLYGIYYIRSITDKETGKPRILTPIHKRSFDFSQKKTGEESMPVFITWFMHSFARKIKFKNDKTPQMYLDIHGVYAFFKYFPFTTIFQNVFDCQPEVLITDAMLNYSFPFEFGEWHKRSTLTLKWVDNAGYKIEKTTKRCMYHLEKIGAILEMYRLWYQKNTPRIRKGKLFFVTADVSTPSLESNINILPETTFAGEKKIEQSTSEEKSGSVSIPVLETYNEPDMQATEQNSFSENVKTSEPQENQDLLSKDIELKTKKRKTIQSTLDLYDSSDSGKSSAKVPKKRRRLAKKTQATSRNSEKKSSGLENGENTFEIPNSKMNSDSESESGSSSDSDLCSSLDSGLSSGSGSEAMNFTDSDQQLEKKDNHNNSNLKTTSLHQTDISIIQNAMHNWIVLNNGCAQDLSQQCPLPLQLLSLCVSLQKPEMMMGACIMHWEKHGTLPKDVAERMWRNFY